LREASPAGALLRWYDSRARELPWRVPPAARRRGVRPDPYRVWLSEIMLQQTTVAVVRHRFPRFVDLWPTVRALAAAPEGQVMAAWAGLGYYARARNLLKCARLVADAHGGRFPETREGLIALPGIGPYTAAAIAAIAFDRPETVVDGNVERIMARYFAVSEPLETVKPELARLAATLTPRERPGDYAQALMDLGATVCTPRAPDCAACPLGAGCRALAGGCAAELPRRLPKAAKPLRRGIAYVARRVDGAWLLERRPARGLLGGMLGWPCSDWGREPRESPPLAADWADTGAEVSHVFTHFRLRLSVRVALVRGRPTPRVGSFVAGSDFRPAALPSVMRKVFEVARPHLQEGPGGEDRGN